jgi:hypothetical protein
MVDCGDEFCEEAPAPFAEPDKRKNKVTPKAKGKAKAMAATCFVCAESLAPKSKWCKAHKRVYDSMRYQAERDSAVKVLDDVMANEAQALVAMEEFERDNPQGGRLKRKKLINWTEFQRAYSTRSETKDGALEEPMTEAEFLKWAQDVKVLSKDTARTWWEEMFMGATDRDNKGRGGAFRLWVPIKEYRDNNRARCIEDRTMMGSDRMTRPGFHINSQ